MVSVAARPVDRTGGPGSSWQRDSRGQGMTTIDALFATEIYSTALDGKGRDATGRDRAGGQGGESAEGGRSAGNLRAEVERACRAIAAEDAAGQTWCAQNAYPGYTSYASLDDLPDRSPEFADLVRLIDPHVAAFAGALRLELGRRKLVLDNIWVNVLDPGGFHSGHIHPHSVVSGTYYVSVPKGASAIRFEDPRLAMMMAAPPRRAAAVGGNGAFHSIAPEAGTLLLWESWLRHEVPPNRARSKRISVSFNYRWR